MNNSEKIEKMIEKKVWAVIGATPNPHKVSNRIYHTLKECGVETYAVNPKYEKMDDGSKIYASIEDLPKVPECIDYVVPPEVTLDSLKSLDPNVCSNIWLQPGTYDEEVLKLVEEKGFTAVHEGACAMVHLRMNE